MALLPFLYISFSSNLIFKASLEISGSPLDFGDCYTGCSYTQTLTIRNRHEKPIEVFFTSDQPHSISFGLPDISLASPPPVWIIPALSSSAFLSDMRRVLSSHSFDSVLAPSRLSACSQLFRQNTGRIDETVIHPGKERIVAVWYCPQPDPSLAPKMACRLLQRTCKVFVNWKRAEEEQQRLVMCQARVCTSMVNVLRPVLNMGDCAIGTQKVRGNKSLFWWRSL